MGKNNKNNFSNRETNVSTKVKADRTKTKVNGGVFVYTGAITAGELAKTINVPLGDVIKFLFMQGKMVTINTILDDELIGLVIISALLCNKLVMCAALYNLSGFKNHDAV